MRFRSLFAVLQEHRESIIRIGMLILMLLFAFAALAFPLDDGPSEADGILNDDSWGAILIVPAFIPLTFILALASRPDAGRRVLEHLSSHIGEKRFADAESGSLQSLLVL